MIRFHVLHDGLPIAVVLLSAVVLSTVDGQAQGILGKAKKRVEVGDFPRRLEFVAGNMELVEWNEGRWLRAGGRGDFIIPLGRVLPDRFTMEFELTGHGNGMEIHFVDPATNKGQNLNLDATRGGLQRNGMDAFGQSGYDTRHETVPVRILGAPAGNLALSERRADAVKAVLVERFRVDAAQLSTAGKGQAEPVAGNDTAEGRQGNRRVELVARS